MNEKMRMSRNMPFSNSPLLSNKIKLFTSRIVIIHSKLTVEFIHVASSSKLSDVLPQDFEEKVWQKFSRP